ncbi:MULTISPECIES: Smr/MutS family protein [unclassified Marichromatium]|uniref:Smr/MutS family protein n=1 Tax=unclassified Marichromatium TaxID=2618417 RepID=UPI000F3F445B|nr:MULTISPECIES: Smr/MutS family protein [unclassified Marichromatium]RNE90587.1 DNA mismatch repair protein MutS [Marichromatium sp. AB31]RNE94010.1 DNA mismatch repair protein MutS [Marichromatium sp. AB32]
MKRQIEQADVELFLQTVGEVTRLEVETPPPSERRRPPPVPRPREPELDDPEPIAGLSEVNLETPEYLLFSRPGIQRRVLGELQRGAIEVGLEVDLHGLNATYAKALLGDFLAECGHRRIRCARIIHGKGYRSSGNQPVLKQKLNYWLRLYDQVLAFCSATRRDGGTGALYVLLRNPDKSRRQQRR